MHIKIRILSLALLAAFLSSCVPPNINSPCDSLLSDIPPTGRNIDLKISAPRDINRQFKIGDPIGLEVDNYSRNLVAVAPDTDLEILWWNGSSRNNLTNQFRYDSAVDQISYQTDLGPGSAVYITIFDIPRVAQPVQVCFLVRGIRDPDGARIRVGADTLLTVNP